MAMKIDLPELNEVQKCRFFSKIQKDEETGCWVWIGLKRGLLPYGLFKAEYKYYSAHRVSYFLHYKSQPGQLLVCHKCDNPSCCNPDHLFLGTDTDNMRDMIRKGRAKRANGERVNTNKLKEIQVVEIIKMHKNGESQKRLSELFGVTQASISGILHGKTWKHLKRID